MDAAFATAEGDSAVPRFFGLPVIVAACCMAYCAAAQAQEPIAELQTFLTSRDCDAGPADGAWGRRTAAAAEAFAAVSGMVIERPITADLMATLAGTDARCLKPTALGHFIPADVLAKLAGLSAPERSRICAPQSRTRADFMSKKPMDKLEGLTSSMRNSFDIPAFVNLNTFSGEMSELVAEAYVTGDDPLKTDMVKKLAQWANADAYLATRDCTNTRCPKPWKPGFRRRSTKPFMRRHGRGSAGTRAPAGNGLLSSFTTTSCSWPIRDCAPTKPIRWNFETWRS